MIGGHKVGGQGRSSRSGYKSWGQVAGGFKVGSPGLGSRSGEGSRFGVKVGVKVVVKVGGQGQGSRSLGQRQGHDRWSQGRGQCEGSRSGEWTSSWGGGQFLADLGQMVGGGRLEINSLFLSRTHDRIEVHSIPIHSNPFHVLPSAFFAAMFQ